MDKRWIEKAGYSTEVHDLAQHSCGCYEIIYLHRGALRLQTERRQYLVQSPALIFLTKQENCVLQPVGDNIERFYLCISQDVAEKLIREHGLESLLANNSLNFGHVVDASAFQDEANRIFSACVQEYSQKLAYTEQRQMTLLIDLLVLVCRQKPDLRSSGLNKNNAIIRDIQSRLEKSYAERINLSVLAKEYHMSVSYLSHLFKRTTGYAVMEYLTMYRLSVAKRLLSQTDMSITEIVFAIGFSDSSNFSRVFKRKTGCSPLQYRKLNTR